MKTDICGIKSASRTRLWRGRVLRGEVRLSRVMKMTYRALWLTWRKALLMAAVFAGLMLAHVAVDAALQVDEPVLFLAAVLGVPLWAISAGVYTFDNLMIPRGRERQPHA